MEVPILYVYTMNINSRHPQVNYNFRYKIHLSDLWASVLQKAP